MKNLKKISKENMKNINGGMKWTNDRCGNVIDLRDGAPPRWYQEASNWLCSHFG